MHDSVRLKTHTDSGTHPVSCPLGMEVLFRHDEAQRERASPDLPSTHIKRSVRVFTWW